MSMFLSKMSGIRTTVLIGFLWVGAVHAQQKIASPDNSEARKLLEKTQQAYRDAAYLSVHLRYLYTNAGEAGAMDSLGGDLQMDKNRCRMVLAGTETVATDNYLIQVMAEDKSIYLSKAKPSSAVNPVQLLDSIFAGLNRVRSTVGTDGRLKTITFDFPPGSLYTRIRMDIDPASGYLQHISYDLHTAGIVGKEQVDQPGHPAAYRSEGRVDMYFSGYATGTFGDAVFDETKYFTRIGGRVEPASRFSEYHIFLPSSNL